MLAASYNREILAHQPTVLAWLDNLNLFFKALTDRQVCNPVACQRRLDPADCQCGGGCTNDYCLDEFPPQEWLGSVSSRLLILHFYVVLRSDIHSCALVKAVSL